MTSPTILQDEVKAVVGQIRAFDRFSTGRRVISLAALGVLAHQEKPTWERWSQFRNGAVHYGNAATLREDLEHLSREVERFEPRLQRVFTSTLTPDILQSGGGLPEHVTLASPIVESFSAAQSSYQFGIWFDTAIDEISHGPQTGEITTPRMLARLMARLADPRSGDSVLDPCCGLGATLAEMSVSASELDLYGQEVNALAAALATLRFYFLGLTANVSVGDALRAPAQWSGDKKRFDRVICDPPAGMAINAYGDEALTDRFGSLATSRSEALFIEHSLESLKPGGRAVVLLPSGFLSRRGGEAIYRNLLIEAGHIEGIIALPSGTIPWTEFPHAIILLRGSGVPAAPITMVDATYLRQPGRRTSERLTVEQIDELLQLYHDPSASERTIRVAPNLVLQRNADLFPQRWLKSQSEAEIDLDEVFDRAREAEVRAEKAKVDLDKLLNYFKIQN